MPRLVASNLSPARHLSVHELPNVLHMRPTPEPVLQPGTPDGLRGVLQCLVRRLQIRRSKRFNDQLAVQKRACIL